ncbi:MAG: hypothetical protein M0036_19365 [Desulfobacteraceae bacterium]|nr:hypothetical protein [Desulfobacteraceae bacterium]
MMSENDFAQLWHNETLRPTAPAPGNHSNPILDRIEKIDAYYQSIGCDVLEYHLWQLLNCAEFFVDQIYILVLKKRADAQSLADHHSALERKKRSRLEVICLLRYSAEGRRVNPIVRRRWRPDRLATLPWPTHFWKLAEWLFSFASIRNNPKAARWLLSLKSSRS